jgi:hypothetical protein
MLTITTIIAVNSVGLNGFSHLLSVNPNPDKPEPKIFATKALRHKGFIYYSFFVPWRLSGKMEKVLSKKAQNSILNN